MTLAVLSLTAPALLGAATTAPNTPTQSPTATLLVLALIGYFVVRPIVRMIRKRRYFSSDAFQALRADVAELVAEHNHVARYIEEIRAHGTLELGHSSTGRHAHLARYVNTSKRNYRRDRHTVTVAPHVYNARSLQVVRNASLEPIRYLMKYFSIKADKPTLAQVQKVAIDIARLEGATANLRAREAAIAARVKPPRFILKRYPGEFWARLGAHLPPVEVPYPRYVFQYVSPGGNSSQQTVVVLDTPTLEALAETIAEKVRWAASAAGQRALMTTKLRETIKARDQYTCRSCGLSTAAEPHLLLEVDHIVPVSRGGLSVPENLQTLCWKCNRTKGAKVT